MTASGAEGDVGPPVRDTTYDAVPYMSLPIAPTHPDHLSAMAALFGLETPDPATARVLELGCASGGNLLPMASSLPDARFVGVDLSARQIEDGQRDIAESGCTTVELRHRSILEIEPDEGPYDYIVCHGVYSWVPPAVQRKILAICRDNLRPGGVAYVSYNVLPGWHLRASVREMLQFHASRFPDYQSRIDQARALLEFLTSAVPDDGSTYSRLLRDELGIVKDRYDSYLFHEHLEEYNEPLYFYRFVERAAACGLRYLCEAGLDQMTTAGLSETAAATLNEVATDIVHFEQYLDFVRNRMFRRTLLVAQDAPVDRSIGAERIRNLRVASVLTLPEDGCDLSVDAPTSFQHPSKGTATISRRCQKAAIVHLAQQWPASVAVGDLVEAVRELLPPPTVPEDVVRADVEELVLSCFPSGMLEVHRHAPRFVRTPGERPEVPAYTRMLAAANRPVANLRHEAARLEAPRRWCATLLDGTRDIAAAEQALLDRVQRGDIQLTRDDTPLTSADDIREVVAELVRTNVEALARTAMLRA